MGAKTARLNDLIDDYLTAHHGQRFVMPNGDVLVMNTDYPRPAFDVTDKNGEYQGHIYPYHVAEEYGQK